MRNLLLLLSLLSLSAHAQLRVEANAQQHFGDSLPTGDYSGISWLGGDRYAVVSDKEPVDGFYIWQLRHDSVSGRIVEARNLGFHASTLRGRDAEGIAFVPGSGQPVDSVDAIPSAGRLFISGEGDNAIREYTLTGQLTGRTVALPEAYQHLPGNERLEALSYNAVTRRLWTCNETMPIVFSCFDDSLWLVSSFNYQLDAPQADATRARNYAHGVGCIAAMDDGRLLVLEREFYVPPKGIGASVWCKLFVVGEEGPRKTLLTQWRTRLTLTGRSLANYEGMTLGPTLADGSCLLILVADSQHHYKGLLHDWIKTVRVYGLDENNK